MMEIGCRDWVYSAVAKAVQKMILFTYKMSY